ncbi:CCA tRNA nucleotidyltransferase [Benzoatithermus flavus]|uniref:CCA tRNA nucleotidyltransferase n=1 Tax=Benzoatithermus flavus TaxID=3108223 RepID=A0ABU8XNV5_9PROT
MTELPAPVRVHAAWLTAPESRRVLAALTADGRPARFVGGCVRDAVIHPELDVADLDIATPEPPERVMGLLEAAGIRVIPTGLKHGTVTALCGRHAYEITTLRRDVACFGRHAEVAFTDDFVEDAARRDFTINTMSCDGEGRLYDPFGGRADLLAGRVRFVGEARARIAEDYLRILRFFRFYARFGRPPADPEALAACAELAHGIDRLSGERVRQELFRILRTPRVVEAFRLMQATGVLARVVPWPVRPDRLKRLIEAYPGADPLLRLAAMVRDATADPESIGRLADRLRLSNAEARRLYDLLLLPLPDTAAPPRAQRLAIHRLGAERYTDLVRLAVALDRADPADAEACLTLAATWRAPPFPIGGADLLVRGVHPGPALGRLLEAVRTFWEEADFAPDRAACLARLDALLAAHAEAQDPR